MDPFGGTLICAKSRSCGAIPSGYSLVRDEGDPAAVGRPAGDVDGALSAIEAGEYRYLPIGEIHKAKHDVFVLGMALHVLFISEEDQVLPVRRRMGEPVVVFVLRHLFLI